MTDRFDTILTQLQSSDIGQRSEAIFQLEPSKISDPRAIDTLVTVLCSDDDLNLVEDATWVLLRYGTVATSSLINKINHDKPRARHNIVHALGKLADVEALPALIGATEDRDASVRQKAVLALGQIGDTGAIDALILRLDDEVQDVGWTAREVLEGFGEKATDQLIQALTAKSVQLRELSASLLGDIGDPKTIEALIDALETEDWEVRFAIVEALGAIGDRRALPTIEQMKNDSNPRVLALATALAKKMSQSKRGQ